AGEPAVGFGDCALGGVGLPDEAHGVVDAGADPGVGFVARGGGVVEAAEPDGGRGAFCRGGHVDAVAVTVDDADASLAVGLGAQSQQSRHAPGGDVVAGAVDESPPAVALETPRAHGRGVDVVALERLDRVGAEACDAQLRHPFSLGRPGRLWRMLRACGWRVKTSLNLRRWAGAEGAFAVE